MTQPLSIGLLPLETYENERIRRDTEKEIEERRKASQEAYSHANLDCIIQAHKRGEQ